MRSAAPDRPAPTAAETQFEAWQVASVRRRFDAALTDGAMSVLLGLLAAPVALMLQAITGADGPDGFERCWAPVFWLAALLSVALADGSGPRLPGQTYGKHHHQLRVVRARDGHPPGRGRTWLRAAVTALILPIVQPLIAIFAVASYGAMDLHGETFWLIVGAMCSCAVLQGSAAPRSTGSAARSSSRRSAFTRPSRRRSSAVAGHRSRSPPP